MLDHLHSLLNPRRAFSARRSRQIMGSDVILGMTSVLGIVFLLALGLTWLSEML